MNAVGLELTGEGLIFPPIATVRNFRIVRIGGKIRRRRQVLMKDWERKLDVAFNERKVLPNAGSVSKKAAEEHARQEYERFAERRREYKEAVGEGEAIKALEEVAKQAGLRKKVEGGE